MRFRDVLAASAMLLAPTLAAAHPHEWVDVASEVLFDEQGRIEAIRHHWRFDEAFSAFAAQGLDADGDGLHSREELQPLAEVNVESLAEYSFFTFLSAGDYQAGFGAPTDYWLEENESRLTLHYTLPLAQPLFTRSDVTLQVFDPEYYIAFTLPSAEAVRLHDAPAGCRLSVNPAEAPDAAAAAALATIGPEQRELPAELQDLTQGIENSAVVRCGGPTVSQAPAVADSMPDQMIASAGDAADQMALGGGAGMADLRALPSDATDEIAGPGAATPAPAREPPPAASGGFAARIAAQQVAFQRQLTETLKALSADGSAFWWLGSISFLYGIVHAAGPGHGKVVISSYLLANEQRVRRGVGIAFMSAFLQALVAIGIVGIMAVVLNMTSMAITSTARLLEIGSFALVAALGIYLLVRKGRQAWALWFALPPKSGVPELGSLVPKSETSDFGRGGEHGHHHAGCCGHHAAPEMLEKPGIAGAAAAIVSVGLRPCSGALIVLVFALAQGIFWAGVASTFLMALGTAVTVAALAALAVGAKDVAARLTQGDGRRASHVMLGLEVLGALAITGLGAVLLAGALSA